MAAPRISAEHPPQILHWLARKAAMPLDRAKSAWRLALHDAAHSGATAGSPRYWTEAMDALQRSLAAEVQALEAAPFGLGPLLRLPARLWLLELGAMEAMVLAGVRNAPAARMQRRA